MSQHQLFLVGLALMLPAFVISMIYSALNRDQPRIVMLLGGVGACLLADAAAPVIPLPSRPLVGPPVTLHLQNFSTPIATNHLAPRHAGPAQ